MYLHRDNSLRMQWQMTELWPLLVLSSLCVHCCGFDWAGLKLPAEHLPYFFRNNPAIQQQCQEDDQCPYKPALSEKKCWGYETNCPASERMSTPVCPDSSRGWANSKEDQLDNFWKGADFGYVLERHRELKMLCKPESEEDSSLECAKYTRFCRGRNIYMDFSNANLDQGRERFREDVFQEGEIGGHCQLDKAALRAEGEHKSPLQSWYAELQEFTSLPFHPVQDNKCETVIRKPTYFMKLDAGINMFHHYCDFINLYASQHANNSFSLDINIVMWDTSPLPYRDFFDATWKAFTDHPIIRLSSFNGKKVCFTDVVFPLLPRMRYGMFYNMPLIPGCYGSSLFRAFSQHLMHRLNIPQEGPLQEKIRVTLLDRNTTYRNIMNQEELVSGLKTVGEYEVNLVVYNLNMPFLEQVKISHNSDILIGMHGAGLTHLLFQPDWAVIIELHHCEDENCYLDLARLRGTKYMTWQKMEKMTKQDEGHHPTLGAHAKFTNYGFELLEFMKMISTAANHVRSHPAFIAARKERLDQSTSVKDEL